MNKKEKQVNAINKSIEALETARDLIEALPEKKEKPKLEAGKWYKHNEGVICCTGEGAESSKYFNAYGLNGSGEWMDKSDMWYKDYWTKKASNKEVEQALIKEAKRRGFKEGVKIKDARGGDIGIIRCNIRTGSHDQLIVSESRQGHYLVLLSDGKWAEIIKEQPLTLNGHEVTIEGNTIKIGCKDFYNLEDFNTFVSSLVFFGVSTVVGPDGTYTTEDLKKIIDKLE